MKSIFNIITTYNNAGCIGALIESIQKQDYDSYYMVIADDGSTDETVQVIEKYMETDERIILLKLEHGERGVARAAAIEVLNQHKPDFILILDSDMVLHNHLYKRSMEYFKRNPHVGAMVIKEIPISKSKNLATKVKVFERKVINNSDMILDANSIEAARLWRFEEFIKSGGINPNQISFEETQPTIRYRDMGGTIIKLPYSGIYHDEKHVTVKNLFAKKTYHFKMMGRTLETEDDGFMKAVKRWYFFRPVMYKKENLKLYFRHPVLTMLMVLMYLGLSVIAVSQIVSHRLVSD